MSQSSNRTKVAVTLSLLGFFVCSFGRAAVSENLPTEEQVARLVAAVWKELPQSINVAMYKTIITPPKSRQQIKEEVEDFFASERSSILQEYEPNSRGRTVMLDQLDSTIEMNVDRIMHEQESPTRVKKRIRISDGRERHDIAYARTPDVSLGPNTAFESTFVNFRKHPEGQVTSFSYEHTMKSATLRNKGGWKASHIEYLAGLPRRAAIVFKVIMGTKTSSGLFVPYPNKIQRLQQTGILLDTVHLTIAGDPNAPGARERIELRDPEHGPGTVLTCDRNDYSRVYSMRSYLPITGRLIYVRQCSNFDSQGFPHNVTEIEYAAEGQLKKKEIYTIEEVELNPTIPQGVFEFQPPEGYTVIDGITGTNYVVGEEQER